MGCRLVWAATRAVGGARARTSRCAVAGTKVQASSCPGRARVRPATDMSCCGTECAAGLCAAAALSFRQGGGGVYSCLNANSQA
jgi:hypothetical protein